MFLEGKKIYLRDVRIEDVGDKYYKWMNDSEINRYLEQHFYPQSKENIENYVSAHKDKPNEPFFAICLKENDEYVGNIKLGPIDYNHRTASIGYMIGEKAHWGKGVATEAIHLVADFAFNTLGLARLHAGTYQGNKGSQKALQKNGFVLEGTRRKHVFSGGYGSTATNGAY